MQTVRTEHLFTIRLNVAPPMQMVGTTPYGERRIAKIAGGTFEGTKLSGTVLPGGGDWLLLRNDGALQLDVRVVLQTGDGQLIYMTYKGLRHGPAEIMDRVNRGEPVDPGLYYFRTAPFFETGSEKYGWLNRIVCIGLGHRLPEGPVYDVHQVL